MTQPDGATGAPATLFTQEQVNHFNREARTSALASFFKSLGMDTVPSEDEMKGMLTAASEYQKQQAGKKDDVQRLSDELAAEKQISAKVPGLEQQIQKAKVAAEAGLKPRYWKYIEGDDDEAIKASVQETLGDISGGGNGSGDGSTGATGSDGATGATGATGTTGGATGQQRQGTGGLTPNLQQGAGSGSNTPTSTLDAGREAYLAKHGKKE